MASTSIQLLPLLVLLFLHLLSSNAAWPDVFDEDASGLEDMHGRDGADGGAFMEASFSSTMFQPDESVNAVRDWYWNAYQRKAEVNNFISNIRTKIAELVKINEALDRAPSIPLTVPSSASLSDLSLPRPPPSLPGADLLLPSAAVGASQAILSHLEEQESQLTQQIKGLQAIIDHGTPPSIAIVTPSSAVARSVAAEEQISHIRAEVVECEKAAAEHVGPVVSVVPPTSPHANDVIVTEIQQLIAKQNKLKDDISKIQKAKALNQEKLEMFIAHVDNQINTEKKLFETQQRVLGHGLKWRPSKVQPVAQSLTPSLATQMLISNQDKVSALLSGVRGMTPPPAPAEVVPSKPIVSPSKQDEALSFLQEAEGLSTAGLSDHIETAITKAMEKLQEISRLLLEKQAKLAATSTVIPPRIDVPPSAPDHSTDDHAVVPTSDLADRIKDKTAAVERLRHDLAQLIERMSKQTTDIVHKAVEEPPTEPLAEPESSSGGTLAELITRLVKCRAAAEMQKHQTQVSSESSSAEESKRLMELKEVLQRSVAALEVEKSSLKTAIKDELATQKQKIEAALARLEEARNAKLTLVAAEPPSRALLQATTQDSAGDR
eukprot:GILK01000995.1.p1 GENE.GILK01000995.1~~GILK01000995.1.p1  ORF type:complete len:606 (-),score=128.66 GILK01000995.1:111-1928(-)